MTTARTVASAAAHTPTPAPTTPATPATPPVPIPATLLVRCSRSENNRHGAIRVTFDLPVGIPASAFTIGQTYTLPTAITKP